jgi:uncharacterized membrane protein
MPASERRRIWELDFLRGFCILCVVVVHFIFDLRYFAGQSFTLPALYTFIQENGGVIFIALSGICVTLGSKSARRGAIVLGCGLLITAVTVGMWKLGMANQSILIQFGILHLLGVSMLVYPVYKKWPLPVTAAVGAVLVIAGYCLTGVRVDSQWLFPLGLKAHGFVSSDYFPLLPHMGWFMLGTVLGRTLYRDRQTRLPRVNEQAAPIRFFCFCGRQSLWIYLVHQPLLYAIVAILF